MAINVKINTLNFDNKLKDCSSRRATEDHVTIRKTRGYKAKLGLGFFFKILVNLALTRSKLWEFHWVSCNFKILTHLAHPSHAEGCKASRVTDLKVLLVW